MKILLLYSHELYRTYTRETNSFIKQYYHTFITRCFTGGIKNNVIVSTISHEIGLEMIRSGNEDMEKVMMEMSIRELPRKVAEHYDCCTPISKFKFYTV